MERVGRGEGELTRQLEATFAHLGGVLVGQPLHNVVQVGNLGARMRVVVVCVEGGRRTRS